MFVFEKDDAGILPVRYLGFHYTFQTSDIQNSTYFYGTIVFWVGCGKTVKYRPVTSFVNV